MTMTSSVMKGEAMEFGCDGWRCGGAEAGATSGFEPQRQRWTLNPK